MERRVKLFLIDGSALAYRSHFAFINNPLKTSKGEETSALYGFVSTIFRLIEKENPGMLAVVMDAKEKTFRHEKYAEYKATREKMPDELASQLPWIEAAMAALRIPYLCKPGFEADDVIGTLALQASAQGHETFIVTGDKDFLQLLDPNIRIYTIKKGETEILDETACEKKWGVKKESVRDFMALMGDASDNVPGVPGVGEKTAHKLIDRFGTLENLYAHIDEVDSKKLRENLIAHKDQAYLCRDLVTIHTDLRLDETVPDLVRKAPDVPRSRELFKRYELHSLAAQLKDDAPPPAPPRERSYRSLDDAAAVASWMEGLSADAPIAFFLDPSGVGLCQRADQAAWLPASRIREAKDFFIGSRPKVTFDLKRALLDLGTHGLELGGPVDDVMIETYLLDPEGRNNDLEDLAARETRPCALAETIHELHETLAPKLAAQGLVDLYRNVELPLARVLCGMEAAGIALDTRYLGEMSRAMEKRIQALTRDIYGLCGEEFNLNSPKQLGPILFEKLKIQSVLPEKKIKKTKTGYATDQETLEQYAEHPCIGLILEYRNLSKLQSTYITALPKLVDSQGRIHSSFNQTVAATGRLSSSDPNLQNIPIRTDVGKEIRKAFVPGMAGGVLLSADYSQIELRLLAHLSQDPTLIETFRNDEDVHRRTAALILGLPLEQVTSQQRSQAKAINFGIIYGMGSTRLAKETGLSLKEAKAFIETYFTHYGKIREYLDSQVEFAKEHGFVRTLLGRIRPVPDILSKNPMLQSMAERVATNSPIQGTAADLIKVAMIRIQRRLQETGMSTRMLLQVHDELVFECPQEEIESIKALVRKEMESVHPLAIPLKVDVGVGKTWADAH